MTLRWLLVAAAVGLIVGVERWVRWYRFWHVDPHYVQQIQVLAPSEAEALKLPAIQPLRANALEPHRVNVLRFMGRQL